MDRSIAGARITLFGLATALLVGGIFSGGSAALNLGDFQIRATYPTTGSDAFYGIAGVLVDRSGGPIDPGGESCAIEPFPWDSSSNDPDAPEGFTAKSYGGMISENHFVWHYENANKTRYGTVDFTFDSTTKLWTTRLEVDSNDQSSGFDPITIAYGTDSKLDYTTLQSLSNYDLFMSQNPGLISVCSLTDSERYSAADRAEIAEKSSVQSRATDFDLTAAIYGYSSFLMGGESTKSIDSFHADSPMESIEFVRHSKGVSIVLKLKESRGNSVMGLVIPDGADPESLVPIYSDSLAELMVSNEWIDAIAAIGD